MTLPVPSRGLNDCASAGDATLTASSAATSVSFDILTMIDLLKCGQAAALSPRSYCGVRNEECLEPHGRRALLGNRSSDYSFSLNGLFADSAVKTQGGRNIYRLLHDPGIVRFRLDLKAEDGFSRKDRAPTKCRS